MKKLVKSYSEALKLLRMESPSYLSEIPNNEQAYHKLYTIAYALNMGHSSDERIFYPCWKIKDLINSIPARYSDFVLTNAGPNLGYRLCSFDSKTAIYFGSEPFINLWKELLL
jgi:hypothetical protein